MISFRSALWLILGRCMSLRFYTPDDGMINSKWTGQDLERSIRWLIEVLFRI